jgi:hypothetical protein
MVFAFAGDSTITRFFDIRRILGQMYMENTAKSKLFTAKFFYPFPLTYG